MIIKNTPKFFVRQKDEADCGPACLLMVIKLLGGISSLEYLRERTGTTSHGTSLLNLYRVAKEFGINAEGVEASLPELDNIKVAILHIQKNSFQHYVVYYGKRKGKYLIADPSEGIRKVNPEELKEIWISRYCITISQDKTTIISKGSTQKSKEEISNIVRRDLGLICSTIFLSFNIAVLNLSFAIYIQKLVDQVMPQKQIKTIVISSITLLGLFLTRAIFNLIRNYIICVQEFRFSRRTVKKFLTHLLNLPKTFYCSRSIGDMVTRLNDVSRISNTIKNISLNLIGDVVVCVSSIIYIYILSQNIGYIISIFLPVLFGVILIYQEKIYQKQRRVLCKLSNNESSYINLLSSIDTIKLLNKENLFLSKSNYRYVRYQKAKFDLNVFNLKLSSFLDVLGSFMLISVLIFASMLVIFNMLSLGNLLATLLLCQSAMQSTVNLATYINPINEARVSINRILEYFSIKKENTNDSKNIEIEYIYKIVLKDLSFGFPGSDSILDNVNVEFEKGNIYYITGQNGSGKTTFCNILEKLYLPDSGKIIINDTTNLSQISNQKWHELIGVIPQEPKIFPGTILENISLYDKNINKDTIVSFCQKNNLMDYINLFSDGLDTIVGEGGVNLSGGQKQLIAFLRVYLRKKFIYILDEPTAAMDIMLYNKIYKIIYNFKMQHISIIISHNDKNLKKFDKILILENGHFSSL